MSNSDYVQTVIKAAAVLLPLFIAPIYDSKERTTTGRVMNYLPCGNEKVIEFLEKDSVS